MYVESKQKKEVKKKAREEFPIKATKSADRLCCLAHTRSKLFRYRVPCSLFYLVVASTPESDLLKKKTREREVWFVLPNFCFDSCASRHVGPTRLINWSSQFVSSLVSFVFSCSESFRLTNLGTSLSIFV